MQFSKYILHIICVFIIVFLNSCEEYDYYAPIKCLTGNVNYNTDEFDRHINVASVALQCDKDPEKNADKIGKFISQICTEKPDVELIVFGEMILGWYEDPENQRSYQESLAETIPGPTTNKISTLAEEYKVYITFGMVQRLDGKLYNAQPIIDPEGKIVDIHHKTFLTPADETAGFEKGKKLTTLNINGIRTGVIICKDQENSLLTESVVDNNCQLVILSFADDVVEDYFGYGSNLSRKYNAWLVTSNRYGKEGEYFYCGEIRVSDPGGNHLIKKANKEQYLYYTIPIQ